MARTVHDVMGPIQKWPGLPHTPARASVVEVVVPSPSWPIFPKVTVVRKQCVVIA